MLSCSKCKVEKPLSDFSKDSSKKRGYCSQCKSCKSEASNRWYHRVKDSEDWKTRVRRYRVKFNYGIALESVPKNCQVCGSTKKICVDHDHKTNRVRGFLCDNCNKALGFVNDDTNVLMELIRYVTKSRD